MQVVSHGEYTITERLRFRNDGTSAHGIRYGGRHGTSSSNGSKPVLTPVNQINEESAKEIHQLKQQLKQANKKAVEAERKIVEAERRYELTLTLPEPGVETFKVNDQLQVLTELSGCPDGVKFTDDEKMNICKQFDRISPENQKIALTKILEDGDAALTSTDDATVLDLIPANLRDVTVWRLEQFFVKCQEDAHIANLEKQPNKRKKNTDTVSFRKAEVMEMLYATSEELRQLPHQLPPQGSSWVCPDSDSVSDSVSDSGLER